jgi:hypothetical protein
LTLPRFGRSKAEHGKEHPMHKTLAAAGFCLALLGTASPGAAQQGPGMDRLEPGQLIADQIRIVLQARGYSDLGRMERDGDTVFVPDAKRYGEPTGPLRLDARTGQVLDEKPLSEAQARALLRERGFSNVREDGREGDAIHATAERGGTRVALRVDARSGTVSQR